MLPTGQSARRRPGVRPALLLPVQARMWGTRVLGTAPRACGNGGRGLQGWWARGGRAGPLPGPPPRLTGGHRALSGTSGPDSLSLRSLCFLPSYSGGWWGVRGEAGPFCGAGVWEEREERVGALRGSRGGAAPVRAVTSAHSSVGLTKLFLGGPRRVESEMSLGRPHSVSLSWCAPRPSAQGLRLPSAHEPMSRVVEGVPRRL